jgi:hypothetical protein
MPYVSLTMVSGNRKVGKIPVSTTEASSCPSECPLKDTDCYGRFGPLGMHWRKVGKDGRGVIWTLFCRAIAAFLALQPWRHNQVGDLPKDESSDADVDRIDRDMAMELADAASHTRGWTYTHYDPTDEHNAAVIRDMNSIGGLTVNLSGDSLEQADEYHDLGIAPVTVILPTDAPHRGNKTPNGKPIVVCPAQTTDISCQQCMLCQKGNRKAIVGFIAHGTASKRLSSRIKNAA